MNLEEAIESSKQRHQRYLRWMADPVRRKCMDEMEFRSLETLCLQEIENNTDLAAFAASELAFIYGCYGEAVSCGATKGEELGRHYRRLSIKLGNPIGHLAIAWDLLDSSSSTKAAQAIQELREGASKGCSGCKTKLGQMYRDGDHIQKSYVEAEMLLLEAATIDAACYDIAESEAMLEVALLYDDGLLGTPDAKTAEHWYNEWMKRVRTRYFHPSASKEDKQAGQKRLDELRQQLPHGTTGRPALRTLLASLDSE